MSVDPKKTSRSIKELSMCAMLNEVHVKTPCPSYVYIRGIYVYIHILVCSIFLLTRSTQFRGYRLVQNKRGIVYSLYVVEYYLSNFSSKHMLNDQQIW